MTDKVIKVTEIKIEPGESFELIYIPDVLQVLQAGKEYHFIFDGARVKMEEARGEAE